jgi:hypothetical protein
MISCTGFGHAAANHSIARRFMQLNHRYWKAIRALHFPFVFGRIGLYFGFEADGPRLTECKTLLKALREKAAR